MENRNALSSPAVWLVRAWSYLPVPSVYGYFLWDYLHNVRLSEVGLYNWTKIALLIAHVSTHVSKVWAEERRHEFDMITVRAYIRIGTVTAVVLFGLILLLVMNQADKSNVRWVEIVEAILFLSYVFAPAIRVFLRLAFKPAERHNPISNAVIWLMGDEPVR